MIGTSTTEKQTRGGWKRGQDPILSVCIKLVQGYLVSNSSRLCALARHCPISSSQAITQIHHPYKMPCLYLAHLETQMLICELAHADKLTEKRGRGPFSNRKGHFPCTSYPIGFQCISLFVIENLNQINPLAPTSQEHQPCAPLLHHSSCTFSFPSCCTQHSLVF